MELFGSTSKEKKVILCSDTLSASDVDRLQPRFVEETRKTDQNVSKQNCLREKNAY